ncbi:hypothetical protein [Variovorax fucosicus]|uniref:hypothetical protein n=1 Tax=Variovorax fucosicus TaxID=3053517 RepID=UPI0025789F01|nr:hypothetical protein [Variovorax sp. J22G47]MDM0057818.1 hypothetical protein [Variovorax sp. J22G47]
MHNHRERAEELQRVLKDTMNAKRLCMSSMTLALAGQPALANPAHDRLAAMSDPQRGAALAGLLRASGEQCISASRTLHQGNDRSGNAFWNIQCARGESFAVQINNDSRGSTRLLNCKVLKAVAGCHVSRNFDP